jgi:hypothetical protein
MEKDKEQIPQSVQRYLAAIMAEHGDLVLPGKLQGQIMADLYASLGELINLNIVKALSDKKVVEYEKMLINKASQEEIDQFLLKNMNYKKVLSDTLDEFRQVYMKSAKKT